MKVEPFGYLLALERSLSATPSVCSVAAKTAGSRPARYSRWACKPEAQFQCALSRNNGYATAWTFLSITRYRNGLRRRGLRHRIAYVARFRVVSLTQFRIFAQKYPFSRSGSHMIGYLIKRPVERATPMIGGILQCSTQISKAKKKIHVKM